MLLGQLYQEVSLLIVTCLVGAAIGLLKSGGNGVRWPLQSRQQVQIEQSMLLKELVTTCVVCGCSGWTFQTGPCLPVQDRETFQDQAKHAVGTSYIPQVDAFSLLMMTYLLRCSLWSTPEWQQWCVPASSRSMVTFGRMRFLSAVRPRPTRSVT